MKQDSLPQNSLPPCGGGLGWGVSSDRIGKFIFATWIFVLSIIGIQATLALLGISLGINPTTSQPYRLFLILKGQPAVRGDLIAFHFPGSRYYPEGSLFVKKITGIPGDHLSIRNDRTVQLNGAFLDRIRATDSAGRAVEPFFFDGIIPDGTYFLYSRAPNSYDSRYYGLIRGDRIVGRVIPLL
jgi:conjugal transfer pilin signal peptidase TrbI